MSKPSPPPEPWSHDFRHVLAQELDQLGGPNGKTGDPIARAHEKQLVGLAFSGGGIRSATFNLGVLQALARLKLLSKFDYLSTVSGGGYIGSWLLAWMKRRGVKDVREGLRPERKRQPGCSEPAEIHFLRRFSNYLTPKLGWLGADMWTVISVYLRNLILNLIILGAAFAVVLLVPRWVALGAKSLVPLLPHWTWAIVALAALFFATVAIVRSMRYFGPTPTGRAERRVIIELQRRLGWLDAEGKPVDAALPDCPAAWYAEEAFGDFVLRMEFKIPGPSHARIFVWAPENKGGDAGAIEAQQAIIHIAGAGAHGFETGAINDQPPVRLASVNCDWNPLEITCVADRCTVRINDQTINMLRLNRPRPPRGWRQSSSRTLPGLIGLEKGGVNFRDIQVETVETAARSGATQGQVQRWVIVPLFIAAFLGTFLFGFGNGNYVLTGAGVGAQYPGETCMRQWMGLPPIVQPLGWPMAFVLAGAVSSIFVFAARVFWAIWRRQNVVKEALQILPAAAWLFFAAGIGGLLARGLYRVFFDRAVWEVLVWGTPALLVTFLATVVLLIGFLGRALPDERREWWSRLSAWVLIYALAWTAAFGVAFYAPVLVGKASQLWLNAATFGWIISTVSGIIAARSTATGKGKPNRALELVATAAPYIFVAGFFVFLSYGVDALIRWRSNTLPLSGSNSFATLLLNQWAALDNSNLGWVAVVTVAAAVVAGVLSLRLDINQFSMHLLYRNRLGRCYLGASNRLRRAQPFTGFSANDDLNLSELADLPFHGPEAAPYPIINAALNLVGGKELAWQQRKAASFVFTPLYCGYEFPELPPGYCETKKFAAVPSPVTLATAMAISGAAASPNMGYHTSPAPAFLMTVFNVRLGWWLGNPREHRGYHRSGPLNVLGSLMCELFGLTSDEGKYIYLSDGGHFENLGIYELVRRRCRFIVASDAEEDHTFGFGGLGNAIEKCRSDFGVDIDIDVEPIRRRTDNGHSAWHCAVGKIHYSRVDKNARDGILVYLKSSLTGDEPTDVLRYGDANPGFPHQSTGDQWFDESQFESYRVLGFHVAENVFGAVGDATALTGMTQEQLFVDLAQAWYPPSDATADAFTKHTRTLVAIYDELRKNEDLAFLNEYIYPEWRVLFETTDASPADGSSFAFDTKKSFQEQLPRTDAELKAGFYLCNSVFQLMEDFYVDLDLEREFEHPDNRGWMNFFKHWSWVPMFRVAWTISASTYGARFQRFCDGHLGLTIGHTDAREIKWGGEIDLHVPATCRWSSKTHMAADRILDATWRWLNTLPVGSNVPAEAVTTVDSKAPGSRKIPNPDSEKALVKAQRLIKEALQRRTRQRINRCKPTQLDQERYAAAAVLEMSGREKVTPAEEMACANSVVDLVLSHASIIVERVFHPDFLAEFNSVERELVEQFFIFNPSLAASARILRFEITPEARARPATAADRRLHFPFGFAILAKTDPPGQGSASPKPESVYKLVYFRVQDHVRRMGLAREVLKKVIDPNNPLELDLKLMHPAAREVPTDVDRGRFTRLYESVRNEVKQKAAPKR
jgi:hypothetical protein